MPRGIVKWFDDQKGYGFIGSEEGGPDLFVHFSFIQADPGEWRTLTDGEAVEFEVREAPKGPQAYNVVRLDPGVAVRLQEAHLCR